MAIVKTRIEAAKQLGITPTCLGLWKREAGFPDSSEGYDVAAILEWRGVRPKAKNERFAKRLGRIESQNADIVAKLDQLMELFLKK